MKKLFGILCAMTLVSGVAGIAEATLYEDAEDGDTLGWIVYDDDPFGATITNIYDSDRGSRVIELSGSGTSNGYGLRTEDGSDWQNVTQNIIEWSMKCSGEVRVFLEVETDVGRRFIWYSTVDNDGLENTTGEYVHHGLGSDVMDGEWHTFVRELEGDLQEAQSSVNITAVNGMYIRGSGRFDDILSIPDPSAVFLLGSAALAGFAWLGRKTRKK
jgi:hypothetical protein